MPVQSVKQPAARVRAEHLSKELRRTQLLDAALSIAVEAGVGAVTISGVAERVGVARPSAYACFTDRAELIDALLRRAEQNVTSLSIEALSGKHVQATASDFVSGFETVLGMVSEKPDSWRLIFASATDPDPAVAAMLRRTHEAVAGHYSKLLRPTLRAWGTEDLDRKLPVLVEHFVSAAEGAVRIMLRADNTWTSAGLADLIGNAVYRALRGA
ncbi:TetR/AcrR family transcriptional regulator [Smaragdicoccus niigatensis]|uniref:TetR/AcrR family transcriptional regulator n=1 Tax=Smaragdicoccus niigatensis TaxID=359359 RepID=UPI00058BBEC3|nr:TetR/AcrR family transcriptional regulator [Smaragdicoccus niigatensis]